MKPAMPRTPGPSAPRPAARRVRTTSGALGALVSVGALASVALVALVTPTIAYAGSSPDAAAAPAAAPACRPWQAPTTVPSGVVLTPRVFPTDEVRATGTPATPLPGSASTSGRPHAKPTPTPKPRVVCRNAPPKPFAHPQWAPGSVVGGAELAADGVVVDAPPAAPLPPEVYDVSYVVADLDSGDILAAKSPHAWLRPASTLKTLTALTLLPRLDPKQVVVAKEDAQSAAGSRVGILAGNRYPVSSLVDAMLMFSANDAVYALADAAGGYDRTVALMNREAARIGAHDTLTVDPSGLDEGAQRSSAYDLALIGRNAMRLPTFRAAIVKRDTVFPGGKDRSGKVWPAFHVYNINELLRHYPGTIGIKPGRTDRAQHTFIGAATRGGRTLVVAQMGSVTGSWKPTAALLDWGFANADRVTPVGRLVEPGEAAPPTAAPAIPQLPTEPDGSATATNPDTNPDTDPDTDPGTLTGTPEPVAAADAGTPVDDGTMTLAGIALLGVVLTGGGALAVPALRSRSRGRHRA